MNLSNQCFCATKATILAKILDLPRTVGVLTVSPQLTQCLETPHVLSAFSL